MIDTISDWLDLGNPAWLRPVAVSVIILAGLIVAGVFHRLLFPLILRATVNPAARLPIIARERGATLIEFNPEPTSLTPYCDLIIRGPAGELLPRMVKLVEEKAWPTGV